MIAHERVVNALWGLAGMLATLTVSTAWDNKRAIAVIDSKVIEVGELGDKLDKVNIQLSDLSGRFVGMRADIQRLEVAQAETARAVEAHKQEKHGK